MRARRRTGWFGWVVAMHALAACGNPQESSISTSVDGGDERPDGGGGPNVGSLGSRPSGGSVGGGSSAAIPPSLSPTDRLSDLSTAEVAEFCESLEEDFSAVVSDAELERLSCALFALLTSVSDDGDGVLTVDRAACDRAIDQCLSSGGSSSSSSCVGAGLPGIASGCSTTVGELAACSHENAQQLSRAVDRFNCAGFANPAIVDEALSDMVTPACATVRAECPALFGGSSPPPPPPAMPPASGCEDTCVFRADGDCDDGGPDSDFSFCTLGTDCTDCGRR
jgi:hypothetical protein